MNPFHVVLLIVSAGFVGCASSTNPASWQEKYTPSNNVSGIMSYSGMTICTQFHDRDVENDMKTFVSSGYDSIGMSIVGSWRNDLGTGQSVEDLKRFGESIGADRISYGLVKQEYEPSVNRVLRFWVANYWRKSTPDPFSIQARFRDLTESESRMVGRRGGAVVLLVVKDGPAYLSDIFAGDIVTELNGAKIQDAKDLRAKCITMGGSEFTLSVLRDGVLLKKMIRLYPQSK
jgi:membrane-associated protease RseP (regulator of RpoE activity)